MSSKFSSPREEALQIALQTRKDILEGKKDAVSIVRACLVVVSILNKTENKKWLKNELSGYGGKSVIPDYRNVPCNIVAETFGGDRQEGFDRIEVRHPLYVIIGILQSDYKEKSMRLKRDDERFNVIREPYIRNLLNSVIDECLYLLNDAILELQYGGVVEYLMEEIRKNTDEKLIALNSAIGNEIQSLFSNLTSTNSADWNKVGHSCRKLLKLVADKIFPSSEELYTMKDGTKKEVKESHSINRLCAFIDQKTKKDERNFVLVEIKYLEDYLRAVTELDHMGEHKESIEKYQADMMAIHTYLILSEILRHYPIK